MCKEGFVGVVDSVVVRWVGRYIGVYFFLPLHLLLGFFARLGNHIKWFSEKTPKERQWETQIYTNHWKQFYHQGFQHCAPFAYNKKRTFHFISNIRDAVFYTICDCNGYNHLCLLHPPFLSVAAPPPCHLCICVRLCHVMWFGEHFRDKTYCF